MIYLFFDLKTLFLMDHLAPLPFSTTMDITAIPHTPTEINEEISSILRAARAELLYPGQNPTPVTDLANQLNTLADGIDLSKAIDEIETADIVGEYLRLHLTTLATFHPSKLVRILASSIVELAKEKHDVSTETN